MSKRILIMAGGTGGHVFPGLAVANLLKAKGWQVDWLGTAERMEAQLIPKAGYPIHFIEIAGVRGNGLKRLLLAPFKIAKAIMQAREVLKACQPDVVLGMGGFAAGPGGIAAKLAGLPLVIHEQNAVAGLTNKLLSKLANAVLMGFPQAFAGQSGQKYHYVGNPVRREFISIPAKQQPQGKVKLLIVGGSLGALCLNQQVPKALAGLSGIQVRHQTGEGHLAAVQQAYEPMQQIDWQAQEFIEDMASAFTWADLIICRAGALTVAEVAAAGLAAIFVPLPHAVDDHQTHNALSLVDAGAALLLPQSQLEEGKLLKLLEELLENPEQILQMGQQAKQVAIADATEQVASVCESLAEAA